MKPIKLMMSAFGSYAGMEEIDFSDTKQGIFLVTGDTGAGKTTIFDAITYALYEQTSGGKRDGNMMRSQYASLGTKTYVEFTFDYKEKRYKVRRNPEYLRESKRKDKNGQMLSTLEKASVCLILPDGMEFMGSKAEINRKIVSIMGIDAKQFTQIVMIAQGDFLKLLHAKSDERKEIFTKLFDTRVFGRIQRDLKERSKDLYIKLLDSDKAKEREFKNIIYEKDGRFEPFMSALSRESKTDDILGILDEILEEGKELETELLRQRRGMQESVDRLSKALSAGKETNDKFDKLDHAKQALDKLEELSETCILQKTRVDLAKKAEKVLVLEDKYLNVQKSIKKLDTELQDLSDWLTRQSGELTSLLEKADQAKEQKKEEEAGWNQIIVRIETAIPRYQQLTEIERLLKAAVEAKNQMEKQLDRLRKQMDQYLQTKQTLEEQQIKLKPSNGKLNQAERDLELMGQQVESAMELSKKLPNLKSLNTRRQSQYQQLEEAITGYRCDSALYEERYEAFLREQAGILALDLQEEVPCPVCGSTHHPVKAQASDQAPSQADVNEARSQRDAAEEKRDKKQAEFQKTKEEYHRLAELMEYDGKRIMDENFELTSEWIARIPSYVEEYQNRYKELLVLCGELKKNAKQYDKNERALQDLAQLMSGAKQEQEAAQSQYQDLIVDYSKKNQEARSMREILPYENEAEANKNLKKARTALDKLDKAIGDTDDRYRKLADEYQRRKGENSAKTAERLKLTAALEKTGSGYQQAILKNGFSDEESYHGSILDGKEIPKLEKKIQDYEKSVTEAKTAFKTWAEETKNKERQSLDIIMAQIKELNREKEITDKRHKLVFSHNQMNKTVREHLVQIREESITLQRRYEVVSNLDKTANGNLSGSVKIDFEAYVQRQYFEQIISFANKRLIQLTSNQFILQCKELKGMGNRGSVGLDLDVYSMVTDTVRDVKTLSGGESFMAALAMALGLADVVQNTVGAIQLKTMFVDEGFGSLDEYSREQAISVLNELAGEDRLIGIISHISELKESIDRKLLVNKTKSGSKVTWSLS